MELKLLILSAACFSCVVPSALGTLLVGRTGATVGAAKGTALLSAKGLAVKALAAKGIGVAAATGAAIKGAALLAAKAAAVKGALFAAKGVASLAVKGAILGGAVAIGSKAIKTKLPLIKKPVLIHGGLSPVLARLSWLGGVVHSAMVNKTTAVADLVDAVVFSAVRPKVSYKFVAVPEFLPVPLLEEIQC